MELKSKNAGFSLVELAIALVVMAILAGGAITALKAQTTYSRAADARQQVSEAREALINYTIANPTGTLPCTTDKDGTDTCANQKGYLPWAKLGLRSTDPWGQPLRYAVSSTFTTAGGFNFATAGTLQILQGGTNIDPTNAVAFAVWSTGEDVVDASSAAGNNAVVGQSPGSDDIVDWTSRYVMFGKLTSAGRSLPLSAP